MHLRLLIGCTRDGDVVVKICFIYHLLCVAYVIGVIAMCFSSGDKESNRKFEFILIACGCAAHAKWKTQSSLNK